MNSIYYINDMDGVNDTIDNTDEIEDIEDMNHYFLKLLFTKTLLFGLLNCFLIFLFNYFYSNHSNDEKETTPVETTVKESTTTKPLIPYEEKYLQEYKNKYKTESVLNEEENKTETEGEKEKRSLKNSFIIEKTPLGNVAMYYNEERECFEYYSDNTMPYRYLETIGRKYVITFDCLELYVNMEEELEKQKEKQKQLEEEENHKKDSNLTSKSSQTSNTEWNDEKPEEASSVKKNVFAKFKNYNKSSNPNQSNRSMINEDHPTINPSQPTNVIPSISKKNNLSTNTQSSSSSKSVLLKERTNSYLCKGRFSNLNLLQVVKKEEVDINYKMSFKDFKNKKLVL